MTGARQYIPATAANPCRHCGATKRCSTTADGQFDFCYRTAEGCLREKIDRQGVAYWMHAGPQYVESSADEPLPVPTDQIADADTRHRVYSALISELGLSREHRDALKARGMADADINARGYATIPSKPWKVVKKLRKFDGIVQVPGFVVKQGREPGTTYLSINAAPGLLIPVRDEQGRIVGMITRPDNDTGGGKYRFLSSAKFGGPKPENRPHVPLRQKSTKPIEGPFDDLRVTEGPLKADIATTLNCRPTLGISGVGNWRKVIPVLQSYQPQTVSLAFDVDSQINPEVAHHLIAFHAELIESGFTVVVETWPVDQGKGIDDLLAAGGTPDRLEGEAAAAFLDKLKPVAANRKAVSEKPETERPITVQEADDDPHRLARLFIRERHTDKSGLLTLRYWHGDDWSWQHGAWRQKEHAELKSELTICIKAEFDRLNIVAQQNSEGDEKTGPPKAIKVTRTIVENTIQAVHSITVLAGDTVQPCWLADEPAGYPAGELLVTQSGILHLPSVGTGRNCLLPLTPNFFTPTALGYAYDPAADCPAWREFLRTLWPTDAESVGTLQEFMGLLLTSDTSLHKMLMLIGPPRSGKGTIGRIAKSMLGAVNVASPTLGSLAEQFGLACLIGKTMALVADARLSGRADAVAVVERLLSITGEDPQDVQRKHLPTLAAVRLLARFVILANELPRLQDAAGALLSRVLLLKTTESFLGREDRGLEKRLLAELPGILNWSIAGWQRLTARGKFIQPKSGQELIDDLEELASPVTQFVREWCVTGPQYTESVTALFDAWQSWCEVNGRQKPGSLQTFGKDLRASQPQLVMRRNRDNGERTRTYVGIRLQSSDGGYLGFKSESPRTSEDQTLFNDPGPHRSADISIARDGEKETEVNSAIGTIGRNKEDRGPARPTVSSLSTPDPDRPRQVRSDQPSLPPWVQASKEGGDAA